MNINELLKFDPKNQDTTVVVGMSGGVDSSVSALILKKQGYNVIGLFMKNWEESDENGVCQASKEYKDVISVCEKIDIPYYSVEFVKEYQENVFSHFVEEYKNGFTPNPDILCNKEIKFKVFFDKAMELGADYLATGHYCQVNNTEGTYSLAKGIDPNKDQSYFLHAINGSVLEKVLFPIGGIEKKIVREIAHLYDLSTKSKKDSTGICFIGERNFRNFLSNYIHTKPGNFMKLNGEVVGKHLGQAYYTIGQRKGLGLGGPGSPWFVVAKDMESNTVFVERGEEHPALYASTLTANEITWINEPVQTPFKCKAKIRYRQSDQECLIERIENGKAYISFPKAQRAITPRQSIVFYKDDICLGGAMIIKAGPSLFDSQRTSEELHK